LVWRGVPQVLEFPFRLRIGSQSKTCGSLTSIHRRGVFRSITSVMRHFFISEVPFIFRDACRTIFARRHADQLSYNIALQAVVIASIDQAARCATLVPDESSAL